MATIAFDRFHDLDEGGLTRIRLRSCRARPLRRRRATGLRRRIVFASETGTGRALHSALENVYEAVRLRCSWTAASRLRRFRARHVDPHVGRHGARARELRAPCRRSCRKTASPTYKLVETQGPPHDRTFVAQVFAAARACPRHGSRRRKPSQAARARSPAWASSSTWSGRRGPRREGRGRQTGQGGRAAARAEEKARKKSSARREAAQTG
ncbi:MAG: ribonuclease III [Eggerthella lenta]